MAAAIGVIAALARLGNSSRISLLVVIGLGLALAGWSRGRHLRQEATPAHHVAAASAIDFHASPPAIPTPPRPSPRRKPGRETQPAHSPGHNAPHPDHPPAPPVASLAEPGPQDAGPAVETVAPITLFQGSSSQGRPVKALPAWVAELAAASPGSSQAAFSSERYATIEQAEDELWNRTRDFVAADLRLRVPQANRWSPPRGLLQSQGFVAERCIEKTALAVGSFEEPMYRVHWKVSLTDDQRRAVVDAWRPSVQEERVELVAIGFLGASGALAFLNLILRSAAARLAARKPSTTA